MWLWGDHIGFNFSSLFLWRFIAVSCHELWKELHLTSRQHYQTMQSLSDFYTKVLGRKWQVNWTNSLTHDWQIFRPFWHVSHVALREDCFPWRTTYKVHDPLTLLYISPCKGVEFLRPILRWKQVLVLKTVELRHLLALQADVFFSEAFLLNTSRC